MGTDTIFGKIISGEVPAEVVYEDDRCMAFSDAAPQAPQHYLVIPKQAIADLASATEQDASLLGHLMLVAARVAKEAGCGDNFRLVVNNGSEAGQTVFHLHLHVLAGRRMQWPPG